MFEELTVERKTNYREKKKCLFVLNNAGSD